MATRYQNSSPYNMQRGLLQRNLLTKSLDYKLKKHQRQFQKCQEMPARDLSTASSAHTGLSAESAREMRDQSNETEDNYITSKYIPETNDSKHKSSLDHYVGSEINPASGKNNLDSKVRPDSDPVQSSRQTKHDNVKGEELYFENDYHEGIQNTVKVRKRNGVFEPVSKNLIIKQTKSKREHSGRRYKTFILSGDAILEIKPVRDKGKLLQSWNPNTNMDQEGKNELQVEKNCDLDEEYAFRRPEYIPPRRDIDSVGVTWSFPAIEQNTTKEDKKPVWSWLVVQDSQHGTSKPMAEKSRNRQTTLGTRDSYQKGSRHSRDIHPVATAMNRDGLSASKVKWCVPVCRASAVDACRLAMERLELIKKPGTCLLCDH